MEKQRGGKVQRDVGKGSQRSKGPILSHHLPKKTEQKRKEGEGGTEGRMMRKS